MATERFSPGDRVRVSDEHAWARGAAATVRDGWPTWPRRAVGDDGFSIFWLVSFDEAQRDADGGGPFLSAEIDERYLSPLA